MFALIINFQHHLLFFYTDPGSGALLFQLIMATLLGGLFYFRKLKDLIFNRNKTKETSKEVPVSSELNVAEKQS